MTRLVRSSVNAIALLLRHRHMTRRPTASISLAAALSLFAAGAGAVLLADRRVAPRLTDKSAAPVTMGALAGLRATMQMALWVTDRLGWNVRWVLGYPGTRDLALALGRGEVDMTVMNILDPGAE